VNQKGRVLLALRLPFKAEEAGIPIPRTRFRYRKYPAERPFERYGGVI
jgi:hypothetical protein